MNAQEVFEFMLGIVTFAGPAYLLYSILCIRAINKETKEIENSY